MIEKNIRRRRGSTMIYYTADLHFHYALLLPSRPFATVEEMDEALVKNWNDTVGPEDTVYLVGDIGWNGGRVPGELLERLSGHKHLIRGNHDTGYEDAGRLYRWFETVTDFNEIDDGETHILLCHYPMLYHKRGYMIHGHLHHGRGRDYELLRQLPRVLNAGVDVNRYRPVTLAELVENNRAFYAGKAGLSAHPPAEGGRMMPQEKGSVRSLGKALELLELLNRSRVPMTLQALSQASGYPKSTIHSLLATLRSYGCIRQESDGRYYLGTKLFEWGCGVSAAWEITRCARPHLERLAQQTQYTALLSCVEGSDIVVIDQRVSGTGIQVASEIGGRTPLHATSQGKLLLSQLPDATVRYLMNGQGMDPFTPHTIVTLPDLLEELEHIRRKGCAIENGEYKIGLRSVSAPVFDREGQMRYTLTVVGLFRHVASGEFEEAVDMVCAAAGSLSRELGYHA